MSILAIWLIAWAISWVLSYALFYPIFRGPWVSGYADAEPYDHTGAFWLGCLGPLSLACAICAALCMGTGFHLTRGKS